MDAISGLESLSVTTAITVIFAVLIILGAIKGLCRGISRQVVRTITIVASAALSFFVFTGLYESVDAFLAGKTIGEVLNEVGVTDRGGDSAWIELVSGFSTESINGIVFILLSVTIIPLLFTIGFILISAVGEIVHVIISAILGFKKSKNNTSTRIMGSVLGAIQGALVAGIIIFPLANAATTVSGLEPRDDAIASVISVADEITAHPAVALTMKLGGDRLAQGFSVTEINDSKHDARDSARLFAEVYLDIEQLGEISLACPSAEQKAIINRIEEKLFSDAIVKDMASRLLSELATAVDEGRIALELEDPFGEMLRTTISIFKDSSSENIEPDMQTILNVYFILSDGGVLSAAESGSDEVLDAFIADDGNGTVISRVIDELSLNERTKPIVTMLTKLSLSIMADNLGLDESTDAIYETVVDGLNEIASIDATLPEEEYTSAVSDVIHEVLSSEGVEIELDESIIDEMAKFVYDEYRGVELTEDEINDILLSYFEAYAKSFN